MEFIDTHTHCSDEAFRGCEDEIVDRAVGAGVTKMILADIDSSERGRMFELAGRYPGTLYPMLGLYPGSVDGGWREEMDRLEKWKENHEGIVAIGEIGLDYHYGTEYREEQKEAFRIQLELACRWNLPVNIHLRDATEDFFNILADFRGRGLRGNLHAFSGSIETAARCRTFADLRFGIGGVVTFKNASLAETVRQIPLERILLETDSPYLAPTPLRGTRNESSNIPVIAARIAELKGTSIDEVAAVTTANAKELFGI